MLRLITFDLSKADVALYERYEDEVLPLLTRHGSRVEFRVRSADGLTETHLVRYPDLAAFERFRNDPARLAQQDLWDRSGVKATAQVVEPVAFKVGAEPV